VAPAAVIALMAIAVSGCGRGGDANLVAGKDLFVEKCGSCHTLARAGTTGLQGPDLDEAFGPAREDGLGEETVKGVVERQIANVLRGSGMPADLVTGEDAENVAAYVAAVAGQAGEDQGRLAAAGKPETSSEPISAEGGTLQMDADPSGALAFASTRALAPPGPLEILSLNESPIPHNIALEEASGEVVEGEVVEAGGTSRVQVNLTAGTYDYLCTVPGHAEGGMRGELTVE
jgi:mono/diheme cytochrome c family protein